MRVSGWLSSFGVVLLWSSATAAQDPAKVSPGTYKLVLENPTVRVFRVGGPAGNKVPMHSHPDHLAIALAPGKVQITPKDGKPETLDMASETASYVPAGAHESANAGSAPLDALVIELKAAPGKAEIPASREGMDVKILAEGPKAVAYRVTANPSFQEPAGTKHEYAQVIIALEPSQVSLSIDGKPAKTSWARGDVQFIGRGVPHESKNTGGKPVNYILVAIR
jgi:oxalate decarboxylase/phosphoglucose isomerase-like protein (cupin superfamily)